MRHGEAMPRLHRRGDGAEPPMCPPPCRFAARPSALRSRIRSRSNSATRASIPKNIRDTPFCVTGSLPMSATIRSILHAFSRSAVARVSAALRKARSSLATSLDQPGKRRAAFGPIRQRLAAGHPRLFHQPVQGQPSQLRRRPEAALQPAGAGDGTTGSA